MTCADCQSPVTEFERHSAEPCSSCKAMMHGECIMLDDQADAFCEPCFNRRDVMELARESDEGGRLYSRKRAYVNHVFEPED